MNNTTQTATANIVIWVGRIDGVLYTDHDGLLRPRKLNATEEQIHSALTRNGWKRVTGQGALVGNYVHSNNFPLDESVDPLKPLYA